jgi:hypothetical protein
VWDGEEIMSIGKNRVGGLREENNCVSIPM